MRNENQKSNTRVFYQKGYLKNYKIQDENVLPFSEFELLPDLKERRPDPMVGDYILGEAERYLAMDIPLLPLSLYRDLKLTGVRSRFENLYGLRRDMLVYMTFAEYYEGKGRFFDKIVDVLWAIMEESSWTLPAHTGHSPEHPNTDVPDAWREDQVPALDLQNAQTAAALSMVYYLFRKKLDEINPIICEKLRHLVYIRSIRAYMVGQYIWTGDTKEGFIDNWLTNITSCILFSTAVTCEEFSVRKRILERSMHRIDNFTAYYTEDGYCDEGPGYWGGAGGNLFDCLELIDVMSGGKITVYDSPLIKNIGEYISRFNIDGEYYLNFSDARPKCRYDGLMMMRYGKKCGSETLYSFGKMLTARFDGRQHYYYAHSYRMMKDFLSPRIKEAEPVLAQKTVWYENNKVAIFRETEISSKGMYIATKGGTNAEMHNHNDVGCLVVYYDGKPVIVDPSHGSYNHGFFGATRYDRWFMKSSYHSVPTVDGIEELPGLEFRSRDEHCDVEKQTVTMDLALAFPKEAGIEKMIRTVSLTGGVATVKDEVVADHVADIHFNYLTLDEPKLIGEGLLDIGSGRTFKFDTSLKLDVERVINFRDPIDDLDFMSSWGRECLWRIVLSSKAHSAVSTVVIE